ncbi:MAG: DUF1016 family protein [Planctomycetaceae bacterium]|nr:DUF1016 family protein [Planctomycetaceae bacterium]
MQGRSLTSGYSGWMTRGTPCGASPCHELSSRHRYRVSALARKWRCHESLSPIQRAFAYLRRDAGRILCTDKSEAVVRYTLPEGNTQIFASRYKLHLPTEEQLAAELQRERRDVELHRRLNGD